MKPAAGGQTLRVIACILGALFLQASIALARDYQVLSGGEEIILRPAGPANVLVIGKDGNIVGAPLRIEPRVLVRASRAADVALLASHTGAASWAQAAVGRHYNLEYANAGRALEAAELLQRLGYEASPAIFRRKHSRFAPADRLFSDQWHLLNTGKRSGTPGIDLNIMGAWQIFRGNDVSIGVVDDGLEWKHPDLAANCYPLTAAVHRDFNGNDNNPSPGRGDDHGTAVAGVLAAASNLFGGLGVAPEAKLAGLRLTAGATDGETEAKAFAWNNAVLAIYNNSWGPNDDGATLERPEAAARDAILAATKFGRNGLGNIFVWAGGNGRPARDDSNYDGYANLPQTIAVGAVSDRGLQTSESERGANLVVVVPSSSFRRQGIVSTDRQGRYGYNVDGMNDGSVIPSANYADPDYTNDFGMTSGAAPQVSGVVALMLQANPRLGWRDVQEILISTARRVSANDKDWKKNGAGFHFNHKFGAGLVDASAAVAKAATWKNLGAASSATVAKKNLALSIPDGKSAGSVTEFDLSDTARYPRLRVEHVQFAVSVRHPYRGDLRFVLTSPSGMTSIVEARPDDGGRSFSNWTFMSVRHWGEASSGKWKLAVVDIHEGDAGTLNSATLTVRGSRTPAAATAAVLP